MDTSELGKAVMEPLSATSFSVPSNRRVRVEMESFRRSDTGLGHVAGCFGQENVSRRDAL